MKHDEKRPFVVKGAAPYLGLNLLGNITAPSHLEATSRNEGAAT